MGHLIRYSSAIVGTAVVTGLIFAAGQDNQSFTIAPKGANEAKLGYYPIPLKLDAKKPANVKKEPAYQTTPKYGTIKLGNGPKSATVVALDEPENGDWKIYIDKNQNGDLTDDGENAWKKATTNGRTMYGVLDATLRASYGTATKESSSADYTIGIYAFVGRPDPFMYRMSARLGNVTIDGKPHKAVLAENDADAVYNKPVTSVSQAGNTRPVWLMIDLNDDGKYASGILDIRAPFKLGDQAYEANISADGAKVGIKPTTKPVLELSPKQEAAKPLLKTGVDAPDFTSEKWGGGSLKLSDYRGKIVILDFWATWCGPCQQSMPHIEKVTQMVKGQDVVVLGVCVWDDKPAYTEWVPKNQSKYTFQFAFDPAGRDSATSIAGKLYNVSGIPTTYIIGKDGKVADAIVGYQDGDTRVEKALEKLGVKAN